MLIACGILVRQRDRDSEARPPQADRVSGHWTVCLFQLLDVRLQYGGWLSEFIQKNWTLFFSKTRRFAMHPKSETPGSEGQEHPLLTRATNTAGAPSMEDIELGEIPSPK